jgi:PAS domain S-box-containing protein
MVATSNPAGEPSEPPTEPAPFQAIVEQTSDAIVFADASGAIRVWNRGAEALFGFTADEVIGRSLDVIIPERFRHAHWEGFRRAIESGRTRAGEPVRITRSVHKLGHALYVEISFGLVKQASGAVLGAVGVGRDGTARFLAEKARRERSEPPGSAAP